ncbi:MAG: succinate dehydrogenase, hydrophobic membrane anchor protein [Gammaproteobacteria bacterium]|nr:succinate dehydrogenase, hydrophobic membrane anchor protein [Gammaproteobacteria bacterium]
MSLKSPLGQVLGLGSARDGTGHWWSQRVTALALLILGLWFAAELICLESFSYQSMTSFLSSSVNAVLLVLLVLTVFFHSMLGVQVVIEDYVHHSGLKVVVLVLIKFAHVLAAALGVYSVLRVGFGA